MYNENNTITRKKRIIGHFLVWKGMKYILIIKMMLFAVCPHIYITLNGSEGRIVLWLYYFIFIFQFSFFFVSFQFCSDFFYFNFHFVFSLYYNIGFAFFYWAALEEIGRIICVLNSFVRRLGIAKKKLEVFEKRIN